jgi:transcriptional regulator with XRE-family HTH domain
MPDALHRRLAKQLRQLRLDRGFTQERLAEAASLSADAIRRLERGGFSPTVRVLNQLAGALGLPVADLLQFGEVHQPEKLSRLLALLAGRKDHELGLVLRIARAALAERDR